MNYASTSRSVTPSAVLGGRRAHRSDGTIFSIILAAKKDRKFPERGNIECLRRRSFFQSAVAKEADDDLARLAA